MQQVIKEGRQVVEDPWQLLPSGTALAELPDSGAIIVPLPLWQEHREVLVARGDPLGVWLEADEQVEDLAADLGHFQLIGLNFPSFTDGRHYSSARLLRERYGYRGEIRALGDVLRDQLFYLRRCGFDAFALRQDQDPDQAVKGLQDFSESYQSSVGQQPLFRRRS